MSYFEYQLNRMRNCSSGQGFSLRGTSFFVHAGLGGGAGQWQNHKGSSQVLVIIICALVALFFFILSIQPLAAVPMLERLTPNIEYRVRTNLPLVALSFDDGPYPFFTTQVLDILDRYEAKATFFLIGDRALRHPELVARIKAAEHEVANHYFVNGPTLVHSDAEFVRNLEETEKAIGPLGNPKLFRPPGGVAKSRQLRLAKQHGYRNFLGCAYPHDPMHPPVWYIHWLIEKNLAPGTIVILHDGISNPRRTIEALPHILATGRARGFRFVSVGELMQFGRS